MLQQQNNRDPLLSQEEIGNHIREGSLPSWTKKRIAASFGFMLVIASFMFAATQHTETHLPDPTGVEMQCPSSPALLHATCAVTFEVTDFMCNDVKEEIERRLLGKDNWMDPLAGKYSLLDSRQTQTLGQHASGDGTTDKFLFTYTDVEGKGCVLTGCSLTQTTSYYDNSGNYCNMHNLLCGKREGCKICRHDIRPPRQKFALCPYRDVNQCS